MLRWALVFLVIALLAGVLGLFRVQWLAAETAWILFVISLVLRRCPCSSPSCSCTLVVELFDNPDWIIEPKHDGPHILGRPGSGKFFQVLD